MVNRRRNKSDVHGFRLNNWVDVVSFTKMLKTGFVFNGEKQLKKENVLNYDSGFGCEV